MRFLQSPATFTVEEIPLFPPSGVGDHVYITVRRADMSTPFILKHLQRTLRLQEEDIGCAGHKDRDAVAIQTFSLPGRSERAAIASFEALGAEVLTACRHAHKLRTGKLAGNRFSVLLEMGGPGEDALLRTRCASAEKEGFPNAFGPQRFADGSGIEEGRRAFLGLRPAGPFRKARFAVSVFQARVFNDVLALRQERTLYPGPVAGDLMKKHATGGEFVAEAVDDLLVQRVRDLEISPTGPIFGGKMARSADLALGLEEEILARHGINLRQAFSARAPGTRRFLRVPVKPLAIEDAGTGSRRLQFDLPPGSYASVLLTHLGIEVIPPERPPRAG